MERLREGLLSRGGLRRDGDGTAGDRKFHRRLVARLERSKNSIGIEWKRPNHFNCRRKIHPFAVAIVLAAAQAPEIAMAGGVILIFLYSLRSSPVLLRRRVTII